MSQDIKRVLIAVELEGLPEAARDVSGFEVITAYDRPTLLKLAPTADILCVAWFDAELFNAAAKVRWVHVMKGGVEGALFPEFVASPVPLTCCKQCFGMPGAQHAMAAMLAVNSRLNDNWWQRSHFKLEWKLPRELQGKTLGIIGYGNIGRTLAALAKPFGMRVLAVARQAHADAGPADEIHAPSQLQKLLAESDCVVIAVPLTPLTRGLIDEPQLKLMKPTAWLIDISGRPAIVNQDAVIRALQQGWIAGADLQIPTAPSAESPLWKMENLIISQYSANSEEEGLRCNQLFATNLALYRDNRPLQGLVDKAAGY
jgi:phosphoglycerate dehydrogenase-like enzyme